MQEECARPSSSSGGHFVPQWPHIRGTDVRPVPGGGHGRDRLDLTTSRTVVPVAVEGGADDLGTAAWAGLLRTHAALVPVLSRLVEREAGMPLSWYDVLLELYSASEDGLRLQQLGERVVLSRSRVSRIVDDLVAADLVAREPAADDRRSTYAVLTPAGRAAFRRAAPIYLDAIDTHFTAHLSKSQLRAIATGLHRVADRHDRGEDSAL